jgi:hypothetical protein
MQENKKHNKRSILVQIQHLGSKEKWFFQKLKRFKPQVRRKSKASNLKPHPMQKIKIKSWMKKHGKFYSKKRRQIFLTQNPSTKDWKSLWTTIIKASILISQHCTMKIIKF